MSFKYCSGTSEGKIMVFDIPSRGTAVKLQETLGSHKVAICDLGAQVGRMASADEEGNIILWQSGGHFTEIIKVDGKGSVKFSLYCVMFCIFSRKMSLSGCHSECQSPTCKFSDWIIYLSQSISLHLPLFFFFWPSFLRKFLGKAT